ncbi:PKD domain-containing protein [Geofilum rubicundum]|uniref:PKD domain-containing protein n=1 Tax=Geofilum rubicundum JCM 15548 TaxID=1236989 RepID=A0A0E9LSM3_9BACT|nr:PKD domain-containing protein [Geofilum rubicundum]GAO27855.1 hypothetical protein JCM15548_14715 [Geofilum rubicundum JCM 15548]
MQESTDNEVLGPYVFDYYDFGKLPPFYTKKIDHWGYFNGDNNLTESLIPEEVILSDGTIFYPQREPNSSVLHYDMLKTVTHPLGGTVTFEYMPNSYIYSGSVFGNSINYSVHTEKEGGGLRVSKISYSGDEFSSKIDRSYNYSNGILYMKPVYTTSGIIDFPGYVDASYTESNRFSFFPLGETPITYEKVIETYSNNSSKESIYSTSLQYPDFIYGNSNSSFLIKRPICKFDILRGMVNREIFYDKTNTPVKEVVYTYTNYRDSNIFGMHHVSPISQSLLDVPGYWYTYFIYTGVKYLTEKATTSFFDSGAVLEKETYDYTQDNDEAALDVFLLKKACSIGSSGESYCKMFQYPTSINFDVYRDMISKNMLSIPIETIELKGDNVIAAKLVKYYTTIYDQIVPRSVFNLKNYLIPSDYYVKFKGAIMDPHYNLEPELSFLNHDDKSNVLNFRDVEKGETSILWNNNKTVPIAVIDNCINEFIPWANSGTPEEIDLGIVGLSNYLSVDEEFKVFTLLEGIEIDNANDYVKIKLLHYDNIDGLSNYLQFVFVNEVTGEKTYSSMGIGYYPGTRDINLFLGTYTLKIYFNSDLDIDSELDLNVKLFNYLIGSSSKCFFEDFEEYPDESKLSRNCKTGYFSYRGVYSIPAKSFVPGDYRLCYWTSTDGLRWDLTERAISVGVTDIPIGESSMYIDDVRVFPEGARMTTYTYDPLKGMTSQTDINNMTRYYDYDMFGRLIGERDFNKDIVNSTRYNYANNGYNPQLSITHQTSDGRVTYSVSGIDDQTELSIDFGDGGVKSDKTWGYYLYPTKGEYQIVLSTSHPIYGNVVKSQIVRFTETMSSSMQVTVNGGTITCSATAYLDSYFYPLVSYSWSFGDGSSSVNQYATHSYATSGTYLVRCTVSNQFFGTTIHEKEISVIVGDPIITATWMGGNDFVCWPCSSGGSPEFITLELHAEGIDLRKAQVFYQFQRCAAEYLQDCQFHDHTPWEETPLVGANYVEFNVCDIESARAEKYRGRFRVVYNGISYYSNIYEGEGYRPCL